MARTKKQVPLSGEQAILAALRARATRRPGVRIGIGDDAAVLTPRAAEEIVVTTDFSIEQRHFRLDWHPPEAIGYKCLARGLSDVAAMGARPVAAFVSLAVSEKMGRERGEQSWLKRFYDGLLQLADQHHVTLAGGDLAQSPSLIVADILVIGAVPRGKALLRSGARAGDILYVSGSLGAAAAELEQLEQAPQRYQRAAKNPGLHPHFYPQPRLDLGRRLAHGIATAAIDISDGLSTDLVHLCEESGVAAEIDADALPLGVLEGKRVRLDKALHGGDDYELLFTASPRTKVPRRPGGVAVHAIGRIVPFTRANHNARIVMFSGSGANRRREPLIPGGWQHF